MVTAYPCEIWPYRLRSRGMTVMGVSTVVSIVVNIFVNPIAMGNIGWRYYIVYVVLLLFDAIFLYYYMPETKHMSLEEVSAIFDGEDALISWKGVRNVSREEREARAGQYLVNKARTKGVVEHAEDA